MLDHDNQQQAQVLSTARGGKQGNKSRNTKFVNSIGNTVSTGQHNTFTAYASQVNRRSRQSKQGTSVRNGHNGLINNRLNKSDTSLFNKSDRALFNKSDSALTFMNAHDFYEPD